MDIINISPTSQEAQSTTDSDSSSNDRIVLQEADENISVHKLFSGDDEKNPTILSEWGIGWKTPFLMGGAYLLGTF